jgi:hypothetical protein
MDIPEYIQNYSGNDSAIRYQSNGKEDDDWADINWPFREKVMDAVLEQSYPASALLLCDLFRAETLMAVDAWSVSYEVELLATKLLETGKTEFVQDFLEGRDQSFDTHCACGGLALSRELVQELFNFVESELAQEKEEARRLLLEDGLEYFGAYLER